MEEKEPFEHKLSITFYGLYQFPCCPIILRAGHYLLSSSAQFWCGTYFAAVYFRRIGQLAQFSQAWMPETIYSPVTLTHSKRHLLSQCHSKMKEGISLYLACSYHTTL